MKSRLGKRINLTWSDAAREAALEARKLEAHGKLETIPKVKDHVNGVDSVESERLFGKPYVQAIAGLSPKTTETSKENVNIADLEPGQHYVATAGLHHYIDTPRKDLPDIVRLKYKDGRVRNIISEGHTRIGAALLRGEQQVPAKVWHFVEGNRGFAPQPPMAKPRRK
jgi:hypothetical protein